MLLLTVLFRYNSELFEYFFINLFQRITAVTLFKMLIQIMNNVDPKQMCG